jgi:hypothetical protein
MLKYVLAFGVLAGLFASMERPTHAGPPCEPCLSEFTECLREATTQAENAQCAAEFRACRLSVCR